MTQHQLRYLAEAFPESLREHALRVVAVLPAPTHQPDAQDTIGPITIGGRPIHIPFRIYSAELVASVCASLTPLEQSIAACLYTRHHDGHVRQRALKHALGIDAVWATPFVLQLLGEYVIDIVETIVNAIGEAPSERYVEFLRENQRFLDLTEQRATSYWNEYFRQRFPLTHCLRAHSHHRISRPSNC